MKKTEQAYKTWAFSILKATMATAGLARQEEEEEEEEEEEALTAVVIVLPGAHLPLPPHPGLAGHGAVLPVGVGPVAVLCVPCHGVLRTHTQAVRTTRTHTHLGKMPVLAHRIMDKHKTNSSSQQSIPNAVGC